MFFIRVNNEPIPGGYNTVELARAEFDRRVHNPVYRSGEHPGDLWELVMKSPNSKMVVKSEVRK